MKKNITLAIVTLALAGLCCAVSLITVRTAAPALLTSHAIALAVGVVLLAVMVAMGPTRLSLVGLMIALCVLCLCLCCFIEESDYGFHQALVMFGQEMLAPAFFLSPSLILLYAWARRTHRGTLFYAVATITALLLHKESLPQTKIARRMPENVPGFSFDTKNGALTNDLAYVPVKMATGFGEPSIVVALAAFWNGEQVWKEKISREPPVVTARCRIRPDGRLALDCRDLYEDEFTLVFDPPTNSAPTSESSALSERWKISLDPQGHLGCTNLWTNARVSQAISKHLNLDHGFVSTAISRTDSRYIKLKITADPDEIAYAKRNKRYCRLVIEKEPTTNHQ